MRYIYKCKECSGIQEEFHSSKLVTNDEKDFNVNLKCNSCNRIGVMFRIIQATNFMTYDSSTPEQKREMLKKRSKEHFKKEIQDKFHQMNKKDYMP